MSIPNPRLIAVAAALGVAEPHHRPPTPPACRRGCTRDGGEPPDLFGKRVFANAHDGLALANDGSAQYNMAGLELQERCECRRSRQSVRRRSVRWTRSGPTWRMSCELKSAGLPRHGGSSVNLRSGGSAADLELATRLGILRGCSASRASARRGWCPTTRGNEEGVR